MVLYFALLITSGILDTISHVSVSDWQVPALKRLTDCLPECVSACC